MKSELRNRPRPPPRPPGPQAKAAYIPYEASASPSKRRLRRRRAFPPPMPAQSTTHTRTSPWPLGVCKAPGPERGTPAAGLARAPDHTHIHPHQGASPWCVQAPRPVAPTITPAICIAPAGRAADVQQPEHRPRARHPPAPCDWGRTRLLEPLGLLRPPGIRIPVRLAPRPAAGARGELGSCRPAVPLVAGPGSSLPVRWAVFVVCWQQGRAAWRHNRLLI